MREMMELLTLCGKKRETRRKQSCLVDSQSNRVGTQAREEVFEE